MGAERRCGRFQWQEACALLALALPPRSAVPASKSESTGPLQTTSGSRLMPSCELGAFAWEFALAVEAGAGEGQGLHPWCKDALVDVWWYRVPLFLRLPG